MEEVTTTENTNPNPLVSIIVITYNSAKYVLETLESAKAQTYQNIELIISDDASQDDTVEICKNWLADNKGRFVRTELVTVEQNTGTSANCNRGLYKAEGEWVKFIAGDDILINECISTFVKKAEEYSNIYFFASYLKKFSDNSGLEEDLTFDTRINLKNPDFHLKLLAMKKGIGMGPAAFFNTKKLFEIGCFNERFRLIEDFPISVEISKRQYRIHVVQEFLVKYRMYEESVSGNKNFYLQYQLMHEETIYPALIEKKWYLLLFHLKLKKLRYSSLNSKNFVHFLLRSILKSVDIYSWAKLFKIY